MFNVRYTEEEPACWAQGFRNKRGEGTAYVVFRLTSPYACLRMQKPAAELARRIGLLSALFKRERYEMYDVENT